MDSPKGDPFIGDMSPAVEFRHLLNQREMAAVRAVSVIATALDFWEAQDYTAAKASLERARRDYQEADARVTNFRKAPQRSLSSWQ